MASFFEKIQGLDRRWVFLGVALVVAIPFFVPMGKKVNVSKETIKVYEAIDALAETKKPMLLSIDYDPGTMAELQPMADAILDHAFDRDIPVIVITFHQHAPGLAEEAIFKAAERHKERTGKDKVYGEDFVFLGWKPVYTAVMIDIGENFAKAYPTDYRGTKKEDLPIIQRVNSYEDIGLVFDIAGWSVAEAWISYAVGRYGANFSMGVTAVIAPDYYPFVQSGQAKGMLGGMRGAAEYEQYNVDMKHTKGTGAATRGMDSQSWTHVFSIILIILGNIAFFVTRSQKQGG